MKALDIVRTPKGGIAFINETINSGKKVSITFIGDINPGREHNAWWDVSELTVIDSIPKMLAHAMVNPFGKGAKDVEELF